MTSHTEYGEKTKASEVVEAFSGQIKGKTSPCYHSCPNIIDFDVL
jgi:hypothetical protein